jgi:hypothetical protein
MRRYKSKHCHEPMVNQSRSLDLCDQFIIVTLIVARTRTTEMTFGSLFYSWKGVEELELEEAKSASRCQAQKPDVEFCQEDLFVNKTFGIVDQVYGDVNDLRS